MATEIKTLTDKHGNTILPRTSVKAVTLEDGTTLEHALNNLPTDQVKIPEGLVEALGVPLGTPLSDILLALYMETRTATSVVLDTTVE